MQTATPPSEASRNGILTTFGATVGLAFGPSVIANLTVTGYITPIEQEFGWLRSDVSFAFSLVAYMIVRDVAAAGLARRPLRPAARRADVDPAVRAELGRHLLHAGEHLRLLPALGDRAGRGDRAFGRSAICKPSRHGSTASSAWRSGCANAGIGVGSTFLPMLVIGPIIAAYGWRTAVLAIASLVLFVSWPVVAYCLREPSAADIAARKQSAASRSFGLAVQSKRCASRRSGC